MDINYVIKTWAAMWICIILVMVPVDMLVTDAKTVIIRGPLSTVSIIII